MKPSEILEKIERNPDIKDDMLKINFCADTHSGHPKIIEICNRPVYLSDKELIGVKQKNIKDKVFRERINKVHDEWLVKEVINKWVSKKDLLYLLGDVSLAKRFDAERFIDRLNGIKFLILGNHDKNIHNSTRFTQISQIKDFTYSKFGVNIHIVLCHYPMSSWNRKIHGSWQLYGHTHCRFVNDGLSFDVGIDRIGLWRPYNLYEICQIMDLKEKGIQEDEILKTLF